MHNFECENKRDRILLASSSSSSMFFCYCSSLPAHTQSIVYLSSRYPALFFNFPFPYLLNIVGFRIRLISELAFRIWERERETKTTIVAGVWRADRIFSVLTLWTNCVQTLGLHHSTVMVYNSMKLIQQRIPYIQWRWKWNGTRNKPQQTQNSKREYFIMLCIHCICGSNRLLW